MLPPPPPPPLLLLLLLPMLMPTRGVSRKVWKVSNMFPIAPRDCAASTSTPSRGTSSLSSSWYEPPEDRRRSCVRGSPQKAGFGFLRRTAEDGKDDEAGEADVEEEEEEDEENEDEDAGEDEVGRSQ